MKRIFLLLVVALDYSNIYPQAGNTDLTFGSNGVVVTDFGSAVNINSNLCQQILLKPDKSFFLVFEMNEQTLITHRLPDGSLDKTYGINGYSKAVFMRDPSAVLQPDGKIVVGGYTMVNNSQDFVIARFNSTGLPDSSFSGNGVVSFDFSSTQDYLMDIALQTDGKILAVGYSNFNAESYIALAQLNPDGSFDNSFSDDGKLTADITSGYDAANAVAIQTDGKIIVTGNAQAQIFAARYLPNGVLDSSFSGNGIRFITTGIYSSAKDVMLQPDGKILIGGFADFGGHYDFLVMRLLTDGTPDLSFSTDSKQSVDWGVDESVEALALQADGKIVAAGSTISGTVGDFAVARFNADGSTDNSFSDDGKQTTSIGNSVDFAFDVTIQPDGKVLTAGWSLGSTGDNYAVVRYLANGSLDLSFADNGKLVDYKPAGYTDYHAITVQADGKSIAAGGANTGNKIQFAVARYNANGFLDSSFAQDGKQSINFGLGTSLAYDVVVQPDGKIIIGGFAGDDKDFYFALARLNANGSMDVGFGINGKIVLVRSSIGTTIGQFAKIVLQPDGKIVMAAESVQSNDIILVRCLNNGTLDQSFGSGGKIITDFGSTSDKVFALLQQGDGKLVAIGNYDYYNNSKLAMVRYSKDGVPDASFGTQGIVITDVSNGRDAAFAAALQADGKIVVTGNVTTNAGNDLLLVRYNTDGSLDNSFAQNGKLIFDMGSTSEVAQAVVVQDDGKIIAAGFTHDGRNNVSAIARFNADGSFDSNFSDDGKIIAEPDRALLAALAIHNNRLYAAGVIPVDGVNSGLVATYLLGPVCDEKFTVSVPDAMSLDKGVDANTVYPGYTPASQIKLLSKLSGGHAPYTYLWSNGASTTDIIVSSPVGTKYSVTVTDAMGCKTSAEKYVTAIDVHCGNNNDKVGICQVSPGNGKTKPTCVSADAVPAQLRNGSTLGTCVQGSVTVPTMEEKTGQLSLQVWPNPSNSNFKLQLANADVRQYVIVVRDALGRIVEQRKVVGNRVVEIGNNYGVGLYFVSIIGNSTLNLQIIKQ